MKNIKILILLAGIVVLCLFAYNYYLTIDNGKHVNNLQEKNQIFNNTKIVSKELAASNVMNNDNPFLNKTANEILTIVNNRRNLPHHPGALADATLLGVDINKNGVRDEIEIILSEKIENDDDYFITIAAARTFQDMLYKPFNTREEGLALFGADECATRGMKGNVYYGEPGLTPWSEKKYSMDTMTFNTYERKLVYSKLVRLVGGFLGSEIPACK